LRLGESKIRCYYQANENDQVNPMSHKEQDNATTGRPGITSEIPEKLRKVNWEVMSTKLLGVVCGMVLGGILVAGLWPFHSPKNEVTWFADGNGLYFGWHGTILSSGKFQAAKVPADAPCSLEIWFEPGLTAYSGTLLTFYAPGSPRQFSLHQSISDLALQSDIRDGRFRTRTTRLYVDDIFRRGKPLFVTVTANGGQVSVYIDGALARTAPKFPLSSQDFGGELIVPNSPRNDNSWTGLLRGLAFYNQELTPAQVYRHFTTWTTKGQPEVSEDERAVALYLFNERAGGVIHNQVSSGTDLYIPDRYLVLDQVLLMPFWKEFDPCWSYWKDVLVNIAGFVPLGFLFCAYFSLAGRIKRPALVTILLGFAASFTIEFLQAFLPTRDSGTTDLITNTSGTCFGVWLYRLNLWRVLIAKIWAHLVGRADQGEVPTDTN
jgi:hypothetical protein